MSEDITVVRRVVVEGFVQGVGYRECTRRAAGRHNVSGWVRNKDDGTVEALVHGAPADVEAVLADMRRGPRGAHVVILRLDETAEVAGVEIGLFAIRPTRY